MEAANCPRCGKMFNRVLSPVCPSCEKEEEQVFQIIRQYIDENEHCTISELSQGTGVSQRRILRFIHDGRLEISKGMHGEVRCRLCGCPITTGQYCDACIVKINQNLNKMLLKADEEHKQVTIMHISEKSNK